jgi:hypothetical protein
MVTGRRWRVELSHHGIIFTKPDNSSTNMIDWNGYNSWMVSRILTIEYGKANSFFQEI